LSREVWQKFQKLKSLTQKPKKTRFAIIAIESIKNQITVLQCYRFSATNRSQVDFLLFFKVENLLQKKNKVSVRSSSNNLRPLDSKENVLRAAMCRMAHSRSAWYFIDRQSNWQSSYQRLWLSNCLYICNVAKYFKYRKKLKENE
jgi:hypothetical protein